MGRRKSVRDAGKRIVEETVDGDENSGEETESDVFNLRWKMCGVRMLLGTSGLGQDSQGSHC
jgi:hypothetical protein